MLFLFVFYLVGCNKKNGEVGERDSAKTFIFIYAFYCYSQICRKRSPRGPSISGRMTDGHFRQIVLNKECAAKGQKQSGRITQMTVVWPVSSSGRASASRS
jgi:hypothetical protein